MTEIPERPPPLASEAVQQFVIAGHGDIALVLLEHGVRLDLFAAAMLGEVEIVRAHLEAFPVLADARGPHGIPLLAHAVAGGEEARGVVELLQGVAATR